jgi:hypothetical protein
LRRRNAWPSPSSDAGAGGMGERTDEWHGSGREHHSRLSDRLGHLCHPAHCCPRRRPLRVKAVARAAPPQCVQSSGIRRRCWKRFRTKRADGTKWCAITKSAKRFGPIVRSRRDRCGLNVLNSMELTLFWHSERCTATAGKNKHPLPDCHRQRVSLRSPKILTTSCEYFLAVNPSVKRPTRRQRPKRTRNSQLRCAKAFQSKRKQRALPKRVWHGEG